MSRFTRVTATALMIIIMISTVTSCTLMSKNRIKKYAEQNIGECKVLSEEHKGKESRTVYLKDKDTGIEYSITSLKRDKNGSAPSDIVLPYTMKNDFFEKYYEYLLDEAYKELKEFNEDNNVDVEISGYNLIMNFKDEIDLDEAIELAKELDDIIEEYDVKGKRINFYKIVDKNGKCLASYNSAKDSTTLFNKNSED